MLTFAFLLKACNQLPVSQRLICCWLDLPMGQLLSPMPEEVSHQSVRQWASFEPDT